MFQITQEHMRGLAEARVEAFSVRMAERLRTIFIDELVEQKITDGQLLPIVRRAMADAASYGVVGEMDVELYVDCTALFGVGFDQNAALPWAAETLLRTDMDGTGKMDVIHDYLIFASEKAR